MEGFVFTLNIDLFLLFFLKITNVLLWLCISNYLVTLSPSPSALTSPHCLPVPILCTTWLPHYLLPSNTVCQLLSLNHWSLTASQSFIVATRIDCLPFHLNSSVIMLNSHWMIYVFISRRGVFKMHKIILNTIILCVGVAAHNNWANQFCMKPLPKDKSFYAKTKSCSIRNWSLSNSNRPHCVAARALLNTNFIEWYCIVVQGKGDMEVKSIESHSYGN